MKAPKAARPKRALNPRVTLRAKTIPSKKRVAARTACRGRVVVES